MTLPPDKSNAIHLLTHRASNAKLTDPGPDAQTLRLCFEAACRAPDHGLLRPFRFFTIEGEARKGFGVLLGECAARQNPGLSAVEQDKAAAKALRAPLIIAVVAKIVAHVKVPDIEQVLCAGAAAQNVLLMLEARGYSGIWRTGSVAYDPEVKAAFGLGTRDSLVGFIYAGTASQAAPVMQRPRSAEHVSVWKAPL